MVLFLQNLIIRINVLTILVSYTTNLNNVIRTRYNLLRQQRVTPLYCYPIGIPLLERSRESLQTNKIRNERNKWFRLLLRKSLASTEKRLNDRPLRR